MKNTSEYELFELQNLRESIDNINAALVHALAVRFRLAEQLRNMNLVHGAAGDDAQLQRTRIARLHALAKEYGLDPQFAENVLELIVADVAWNHPN